MLCSCPLHLGHKSRSTVLNTRLITIMYSLSPRPAPILAQLPRPRFICTGHASSIWSQPYSPPLSDQQVAPVPTPFNYDLCLERRQSSHPILHCARCPILQYCWSVHWSRPEVRSFISQLQSVCLLCNSLSASAVWRRPCQLQLQFQSLVQLR